MRLLRSCGKLMAEIECGQFINWTPLGSKSDRETAARFAVKRRASDDCIVSKLTI